MQSVYSQRLSGKLPEGFSFKPAHVYPRATRHARFCRTYASASGEAALPADGAIGSQEESRRLWFAAIKPPMYTVGTNPVLVSPQKCCWGYHAMPMTLPPLHVGTICYGCSRQALCLALQVAAAAVYAQSGAVSVAQCLSLLGAAICVIAWLNLRYACYGSTRRRLQLSLLRVMWRGNDTLSPKHLKHPTLGDWNDETGRLDDGPDTCIWPDTSATGCINTHALPAPVVIRLTGASTSSVLAPSLHEFCLTDHPPGCPPHSSKAPLGMALPSYASTGRTPSRVFHSTRLPSLTHMRCHSSCLLCRMLVPPPPEVTHCPVACLACG